MTKKPIILSAVILPTPALVRADMDALPSAIVAHGYKVQIERL
jgi:hypothetical protein